MRQPGESRVQKRLAAIRCPSRPALPNARIVHVRRNPAGACLSCFFRYFGGDLPFACDLAELGRYYRAYAELMAHWRSVLPEGAMLEVQYEAPVADFPAEARRLVAYCGLEWDERCSAFYETRRAVTTSGAPANLSRFGRRLARPRWPARTAPE
ncbi:sulfotransferase [Methylocapsa sp. S129]|uniref:sulfotransferase family protein n=1 Tax=Methylocapsa sp. S129 TaxID=1641869 RepID=UPI001AED1508|nr:sulfotransferase [Methylocapsa sp. S129]